MRTDRLSRRRAVGLMTLGGVAASALAPRPPRRRAAAGQGQLPDQLARPGRAWRLLPGARHRHLQGSTGSTSTIRLGGPQLTVDQLLLAGKRRLHHGQRLRAPELRQARTSRASPSRRCSRRTRRFCSPIPAPATTRFAPLKGKPILIGADRADQLLAVPQGQVRLHRRPDPPLHLQHGAVPGRQERHPARLPDQRTLCHQKGGLRSRRPSARRRRLRQLLTTRSTCSPKLVNGEARIWCSASSTPRSRAGTAISTAIRRRPTR